MTTPMFLLMSLAAAHASAQGDPLTRLKQGRPAPVARLIERIVECNHWSGEDAYDAARGREIGAAVDRLHCDELEHDEAAIRKQYRADSAVGAAIDSAKSLYE